jgi:hypothetical protein
METIGLQVVKTGDKRIMNERQGQGGELGQSDYYQQLLGQISDTYTQGRIRRLDSILLSLNKAVKQSQSTGKSCLVVSVRI